MSHSALLKDFRLVRGTTLQSLDKVNEDVIHTVPEGFSNNILWHVGHILVSAEQLLLRGANASGELPDEYKGWFAIGTKPADWNGELPSLRTLADQLREQQERVETVLADRLQEKLAKPLQIRDVEFTTYAEVLSFAMFHEGMHLGQINAMNRLLSASRS